MVLDPLKTTKQSSERIIASSSLYIEEMDAFNENVRTKLTQKQKALQSRSALLYVQVNARFDR